MTEHENTQHPASVTTGALIATGVTFALLAFCASVLFMKYIGLGEPPKAETPQIRVIDLASITTSIVRPNASEEELKTEANRVADAIERLRRTDIFVINSAALVSAPKGSEITYEELMRMTQLQPVNAGSGKPAQNR